MKLQKKLPLKTVSSLLLATTVFISIFATFESLKITRFVVCNVVLFGPVI